MEVSFGLTIEPKILQELDLDRHLEVGQHYMELCMGCNYSIAEVESTQFLPALGKLGPGQLGPWTVGPRTVGPWGRDPPTDIYPPIVGRRYPIPEY